jgi:hypothetical protein
MPLSLGGLRCLKASVTPLMMHQNQYVFRILNVIEKHECNTRQLDGSHICCQTSNTIADLKPPENCLKCFQNTKERSFLNINGYETWIHVFEP